jgi:Na+-driven multidrug efflux pump
MRIIAVLIPVFVVNVGCFFVLRAGGATTVTFLFDSGSMWLVAVPVAFVLAKFTPVSIFYLYLAVQGVDVIKMMFGIYLVSKKTWVRNLTIGNDV